VGALRVRHLLREHRFAPVLAAEQQHDPLVQDRVRHPV
jgi:hypothetical protein